MNMFGKSKIDLTHIKLNFKIFLGYCKILNITVWFYNYIL